MYMSFKLADMTERFGGITTAGKEVKLRTFQPQQPLSVASVYSFSTLPHRHIYHGTGLC